MYTKVLILLLGSLFGAGPLNEALGQPTDPLVSLDLRSTPDGQLFYAPVSVGEGPARQTFNLLTSTTYYMTWIPSTRLKPSKGYANKTAALYYTDHFFVHSDTVQLSPENVILHDQQFAVLRRFDFIDLSSEPMLDGMLGLSGYEAKPDTGVEYLFKRLYSSAHINKLKFSLYINNSQEALESNNESENAKGALVFGGVDEKYYTGEFIYAQMHERLNEPSSTISLIRKTSIVSGVQLDWAKVTNRTTVQLPPAISTGRVDLDSTTFQAGLRLDSTAKLFVGHKVILDQIHLDFMGAQVIGERGIYVFNDCHLDNKPDVVFLVDDIELRITPEDYVLSGEIENKRHCFSAFKPYSSYPVWVFGTRFLRKYYTAFDFQNDTIGFAKPK